MIPKIIHYCWFGKGKYPDLAEKCIESWKKYLPEYKIMKWDEDSFDISLYQYTKEAYEFKKYAFVADVCRLYALEQYGGIYMDTDIEILKSLDSFLEYPAFCGFESDNTLQTGIIGSEKNGLWVSEMLSFYNNKDFIDSNGKPIIETNVTIISNLMKKKGFILNNKYQFQDDYVVLYPSEYFCPKDFFTGILKITDNTHCIHHFDGSWLDNKAKIKHSFIRFVAKVFGKKAAYILLNWYKKMGTKWKK